MEKEARNVVKKLKKAGFYAYWAGGSVRDILLGEKPNDYDIATNAKPKGIERIFKKTIPTGKKYGVITVVVGKNSFEVTTFREDIGTHDGRRPNTVLFTNAQEDAVRRDFTINGIFYDPIEKKMIDYVGGKKDLEHKIIRFIGNPEERIKEDNLRIIRAVRFKNALNFKYDPKTKKALVANAARIKNVSGERLRDELNKMLEGRNKAASFFDLEEIGIMVHIIPEISATRGVTQPRKHHPEGDVFKHTVKCLRALEKENNKPAYLIWAVLLHDIGKPDTRIRSDRIRFNRHMEESAKKAEAIMTRLRFSRQEIKKSVWLIRYHHLFKDFLNMRPTRQKHWMSEVLFPDLLDLFKADALGSGENLEHYEKCREIFDSYRRTKKKEIKILLNGNEVIRRFKIKEGPQVGEILRLVKEAQLEEKIKTKPHAIKFVSKFIRENK